ncbi:AAA family ATPase [Qipengyuania aquimaris]|uniref:AAA family ATPase n=1 Tax=Qipengyuania aquimaris TaxID=255984 RepID=UPI001FD401F7|nr:AAA family ATPase [Qipengyuania aquimaris]UOR15267.1 AAA family ATPase [Qipengyuania aquimaris]
MAKISGAGVWQDYTAAEDQIFAPKTLVYGFNGTGKTTLSRIFSSVRRQEREDRLPEECQFKVEFSDGSTATEKDYSNPLGKNLLVFNTDYVRHAFSWDESSSEGIVYLSEAKAEAHGEFKLVGGKLESARMNLSRVRAEHGVADDALAKFKTRVARNVREIAASSGYTQSYDARKIQNRYSAKTYGTDLKLDEEEFKRDQQLLAERQPAPELDFSPTLPPGIVEWFRASQEAAKQDFSELVANEFEQHSAALLWIEQGLQYHEKNSLENCLLCGNEFTEERRASLKSVFDDSWRAAVRSIEESVQEGTAHQNALRELYRSIPSETAVSPSVRSDYRVKRHAMESILKDFGVRASELLELLDAKLADPTKEQVLPDALANFNLDVWTLDFSRIEGEVGSIIQEHNEASGRFNRVQIEAFSRIEAHVLASNQEEWSQLNKMASELEGAVAKANNSVRALSARYESLSNVLRDHGVGADKLNELIWAYLGHKEFRLVADENGGYKIKRRDGRPATELSEGERTAVSFSYFLTELGSEGRDIKDLVVVIDDPISSLDTSARTYAYSLMMRMTKKCAQVIVLTHNANFMSMIKRQFQSLQRQREDDDIASLLFLDCQSSTEDRDRVTTLVRMPGLLEKFDSEYHYLFDLVRGAAETKKTDHLPLLPNATRKLLEIFATFCSPGSPNFSAALMDHHSAIKDKVDIKALERLIQIESHGTMESITALPDLTLETAIRGADAAMKFIKAVGPDHHKRMVRACA